jgi:lantibiotic modifying enzyme
VVRAWRDEEYRNSGAPRTEDLGLMVGLAGIGYGLLRAAYPERVPAVLLETPGSMPSTTLPRACPVSR